MAVIREQRRFQIGNIGVVRVSDAAERAAVSAMNNADKLIDMAFKGASREAEKAGVELAESLSASNIRTINPKTGLPEAFDSQPNSFGKIAADAFEKTIDDRYKISIDQEIKAKAAEYAFEADKADDPVTTYENTFGDYIDQMKSRASGRYKNYINLAGTSYLASTKLNLQEAVLKRQRQQSAVTAAEYIQNEYPTVLGMITSGATEQDIDAAIADMEQKIDNAEANRGFDGRPAEALRLRNIVGRAKAEGYSQLLAAEDLPVADLIKIKSALQTNGQTLSAVPESLRPRVQQILDNSNYSRDNTVITGIFDSAISTKNAQRVEGDRVVNEANQEAYPALNAGIETNIKESAWLYHSSNTLDAANLERAYDRLEKNEVIYQGFSSKKQINSTDPARYTDMAKKEIEAGLIGRIVADNLGREQIMAIQSYLLSRGASGQGVPEPYKAALDVMINRKGFDETRMKMSLSGLETDQATRDTIAKRNENEANRGNYAVLQLDFLRDQEQLGAELSSKMATAKTADDLASVIQQIKTNEESNREIAGQGTWLTGTAAFSAESAINNSVANSWVGSLLESGRTFTMETPNGEEVSVPMTSDLMNQVAIGLDKFDPENKGLPKELREQVRVLTENMSESQLKTAASAARVLAGQMKEDESELIESAKKSNARIDILNRGVGNTKYHKQAVENYVFNDNGVPQDFFRTSQSLNDEHPATKAMLNLATEGGRIPEIIVSDLSALANGQMVQGAPNLLQLYKGMRSYYDKNTNRMKNLFVGTMDGTPQLSKKDRANLDSILAMMDIRGEFKQEGLREDGSPNYVYNIDQLSNVLTDFNNESLNSVEAELNLKSFMGNEDINPKLSGSTKRTYAENDDGLAMWLLDSVGGSRSVFRDLYPYAKQLVANGQMTDIQIQNRIKQLYQDEYPETMGYVIDHRVRDVGRSRYSLLKTIPNADERMDFINYIESKLPRGFSLVGTGQTEAEETGSEGFRFGQGFGYTGQLMQMYNGYADWMAEPYDRDKDVLHKVTMSGERKAYLMPQRFSGDSQVTYMVMTLDVNNELTPVTNPDGEILSFSTNRREPE